MTQIIWATAKNYLKLGSELRLVMEMAGKEQKETAGKEQ
jgi:hypothetical protein